MSDLHIVYTEAGDEYGWTIESPQIPELVGGNQSIAELVAETPSIVQWAKQPNESFDRVLGHEQHLVEAPDGRQYLIRWQFDDGADDEDYEARYHTASRLNFAVTSGLVDSDEYGEHPVIPTTGERLYIAVVSTDTLGWVGDQLSGRDGCCVLAEHLGDGAVRHIPYGRTGILRRGVDTDDLGLTSDSTIHDVADALLAHEVESLRKTYLPVDAVTELPRHIPDRLTMLR